MLINTIDSSVSNVSVLVVHSKHYSKCIWILIFLTQLIKSQSRTESKPTQDTFSIKLYVLTQVSASLRCLEGITDGLTHAAAL